MSEVSKNNRKALVRGILFMVLCFIVCCIVLAVAAKPESYDIKIGEISTETITAPDDIVDEISTRKLEEEERAKVGPVYTKDGEATVDSLSGVSSDFAAFEEARSYAQKVYVNAQIIALQKAEDKRVNGVNEASPSAEPETARVITEADVAFDPAAVNWETALSEENYAEIQAMLPSYVGQTDIQNIISITQSGLSDMLGSVYSECDSALEAGISSDGISAAVQQIILGIEEDADISAQKEALIKKCLEKNLKANVVFNEEATKVNQDEAAEAVEPVTYKKGQNIVVRGEVVTESQYTVLEQAGLLSDSTENSGYMWVMLYMGMLFAAYMIYLITFVKKIACNIKYMGLLSILTAFTFIVCAVVSRFTGYVLPAFIAIILFAAVISPKSCVAFSAFIALLVPAVSTQSFDFITASAFIDAVATVISAVLIGFVINKVAFRGALILAGAVSAIPCVIIEIIRLKLGMITTAAATNGILWETVTCALFGVVSVGLLPLVESMFNITTPMKLLELSDPNNPLLKRLLVEAPGTYHHSLFVGNLAEAACEAVGGDSLLARVGAYYHDVGKLKNPKYFVENQRNGKNPHDLLDPQSSADIIKSHVRDGRTMLEKAKLPKEILAMETEHHGDTIVAYFYHKAKQEDDSVSMDAFRYQSEKPRTKESAIVMLADSVEAAMRSMDEQSTEEIYAFIKKIIKGKYDDGQLDYVPLTFRDLTMIARAFTDIYAGASHSRIKYPEIRAGKVEDDDNNI